MSCFVSRIYLFYHISSNIPNRKSMLKNKNMTMNSALKDLVILNKKHNVNSDELHKDVCL